MINGSEFTSQGSSDTARSACTVARQSYYAQSEMSTDYSRQH